MGIWSIAGLTSQAELMMDHPVPGLFLPWPLNFSFNDCSNQL